MRRSVLAAAAIVAASAAIAGQGADNQIEANIRTLGFKLEDVRILLKPVTSQAR